MITVTVALREGHEDAAEHFKGHSFHTFRDGLRAAHQEAGWEETKLVTITGSDEDGVAINGSITIPGVYAEEES
jgi:hypothetical protein